MTERELFAEALRRADPACRGAFLSDSCRGDDRLRARVEALLAVHEAGPSVLARTPLELLERIAEEEELPPAETSLRQLLPFLEPASRPDGLGRLGHYELLSVLGQGGFGIVLRSYDDALRREVAVKVLAPHLAAAVQPRKRFVREAHATGRVQHEHVAAVYAVEKAPLPYQVMEYVPGRTLQQRLDQDGPLPPPEAARLGRQVALGLAAAHAQGLVHRDVKPANILLTAEPEPRVKLTDFGLARAFDDAGQTVSGTTLGSPLYMAPEQARGQPLDPRADLFSLGCVLYAMLTGRPPFEAPSTFAVLRRVVEDTPEPVADVVPGVPPGLAAVLDRLLAKSPADRYPTAEAAAAALADSLTARPPRPWRWPILLAILCVAAVTVWAAGPTDRLVTTQPEPTPPPTAGPMQPEWDEVAVGRLDLHKQVQTVTRRLCLVNPGLDDQTMSHEVVDGQVAQFTLHNSFHLRDLSPLRAFAGLRQLSLYNPGPNGPDQAVLDLRQLTGMKLTSFRSFSNRLADLSPLADMPLEAVSVWFARTNNLDPLRRHKLTWLNAGATGLSDLSLFRGMPLRYVCVNISPLTDLSPLTDSPLEELECQSTKVSDLAPLAGKRLRKLWLKGSPVSDFRLLRDMPLEDVTLDYDPAKHADLLRAIPTLRTINGMPAVLLLARHE